MRSWIPTLLLLGVTLAGCADVPDEPDALLDHDAIARLIGEPITIDHDHNDASLHTGSHNVDFVSWTSLGVELGVNGFANFVFWESDDGSEDLAFVAIDGDERAGFVIADVSDPLNVKVLGSYMIDGNSVQEVRVTPDGRHAAMNVQDLPAPGRLTDGDGASDCSACIHVVNVEDRTAPRLESVTPVELLGTHNLHFEEYDDGVYLFYVGQPLLGTNPDPVGNQVTIARLQDSPGGAFLAPVSQFRHDTSNDAGRSFPHDVLVQEHPVTGQKLAYVSHWQGGAIIFDVTNPVAPLEIGRYANPAPSELSNIHWIMQEPQARGAHMPTAGRVFAWSAPEIGSLASGSGIIRAYDVTDPGVMNQVGSWRLPGTVPIEGRFIMSPHTAIPDQQRGLLAVAHYHAGVWILDIADPTNPRALGYYLPHGDPTAPYDGDIWWKKPNFSPDGFLPNAYQARWKDDLLWVTERGTGLYVLEYTGPVPGSLV